MEDTELIEYADYKERELAKASVTRKVVDKQDHRVADGRDDADRDYARVLYSSAFRRLQDKMQLFIPNQSRFHRNRLTHSLEVAQIAKIIAKRARLKDTLTVQTCSLAHDIGNPPFGHYGESVLDELCRLTEGASFEGNAQTYRVLRMLEEKHHAYNGLNLTWRTLFGVVKYPNDSKENSNQYPKEKEKYLYDNDWVEVKKHSAELGVKIGRNGDKLIRTIDAEIMDIADEIAYAAHDLQDALKQGYFTIDELLYEFRVSEDYKSAGAALFKIVKHARKFASMASTYKTSEEYSSLFLRELSSEVVNSLVCDVGVVNNEIDYKNFGILAVGLKKLTYEAVGRKRDIKQYELMGEKILRGLFEVYTDKSYNKKGKLLPTDYISSYYLKEDKGLFTHAARDYIAGMMDSFAVEQYKKYFGESELNKIYFKEK